MLPILQLPSMVVTANHVFYSLRFSPVSLFQSRLIDVTLSNMGDIEGTVVMKVEENVTPHDGLICIGKEILR